MRHRDNIGAICVCCIVAALISGLIVIDFAAYLRCHHNGGYYSQFNGCNYKSDP